MAGFDWNAFYSLFQLKMESVCTVGRYTIPKSPKYPYCDVALSDNPSGHYDLQGNEVRDVGYQPIGAKAGPVACKRIYLTQVTTDKYTIENQPVDD